MALVAFPAQATAPTQNDLVDQSQPYLEALNSPLERLLTSSSYEDDLIETRAGYADALYALTSIPESTTLTPPPSTYCSCVSFAKAVLGKSSESWGNADTIKPNTSIPALGAVILLADGEGHVGVITGVSSQSITFEEANYKHCEKDTRTIPLVSKEIIGYHLY